MENFGRDYRQCLFIIRCIKSIDDFCPINLEVYPKMWFNIVGKTIHLLLPVQLFYWKTCGTLKSFYTFASCFGSVCQNNGQGVKISEVFNNMFAPNREKKKKKTNYISSFMKVEIMLFLKSNFLESRMEIPAFSEIIKQYAHSCWDISSPPIYRPYH